MKKIYLFRRNKESFICLGETKTVIWKSVYLNKVLHRKNILSNNNEQKLS